MKKITKKYVITFITILLITLSIFYLLTFKKNLIQPNKEILDKFNSHIDASLNGYLLCPDAKNIKLKPLLEKAFTYYSTQKDQKALYVTGIAYINGIGVSKNFDKGIELVHKSALEGYIPAQTSYANILVDRKNRGKSLSEINIDQKTLGWLKDAALKQDASANFSLGTYYAITGRIELSVPLFEKAAAQENVPISAAAQYQIGELYSFGYGFTQNNSKSLYWYKKSVNHKPISMSADGAMAALMFIYGKPDSPLYDWIESGYWSRQLEKMEQWMKRCQETDPDRLDPADLTYPNEPIQ